MAKRKLRNLSLQDLEAEIQRRRRDLDKLERERDRLTSKLSEVEGQILAISGSPRSAAPAADGRRKGRKKTAKAGSANGRRRPGGRRPLADVLVDVMSKDEPKRVSELAKEVQAAGYKSKSKTFPTIVNQVLVKNPQFKKVARGQYVLA